jgi:RNA polymerase sigma-32 factor
VKIGTTNEQKKVFFNLMKEKARLEAQGIRPDTKLLAENMGVSEKTVMTMDQRLSSTGGEVSIDAPSSHNDSSNFSALSNILADEAEGPEEQVAMSNDLKILQDHLKDYLKGLKDRDRDIFTKRLLQDIPPSLQEIADEYGVSRERIRQIEERLLKNLKVYMADYIR